MLSSKQLQFITDDAPFVVADGSVRSSKTIAQIIKWMRWLPDAPRTGLLLITGRTADTVGRNILEVIVQLDPRAIQWTPGANVCTVMGRRSAPPRMAAVCATPASRMPLPSMGSATSMWV